MPVERKADSTGTFKVVLTIDPASIAATTTGETTTAVPSTQPQVFASDEVVAVKPPSGLNAGLVVSHAFVAAANSITLRLGNTSIAALDAASGSYTFFIARF